MTYHQRWHTAWAIKYSYIFYLNYLIEKEDDRSETVMGKLASLAYLSHQIQQDVSHENKHFCQRNNSAKTFACECKLRIKENFRHSEPATCVSQVILMQMLKEKKAVVSLIDKRFQSSTQAFMFF